MTSTITLSAAIRKRLSTGRRVNSAQRSAMVQQSKNLRNQHDRTAKASGYGGIDLLTGDDLEIAFNEKTGTAQSKPSIPGNVPTASSIGIGTFVDTATSTPGATSAFRRTPIWARRRMRRPTRSPTRSCCRRTSARAFRRYRTARIPPSR